MTVISLLLFLRTKKIKKIVSQLHDLLSFLFTRTGCVVQRSHCVPRRINPWSGGLLCLVVGFCKAHENGGHLGTGGVPTAAGQVFSHAGLQTPLDHKLRRIAEAKNRAGICLPIADPEGIGGPGGQVGGLQGSLPCTAVVAVFSVLTRLQRT